MCLDPLFLCPTESGFLVGVICFPFWMCRFNCRKGGLVPWDPPGCIPKSWSRIGYLVPLGSPKIRLLFSEFCKLFEEFRWVGYIKLYEVCEVLWGILKWGVRWVGMIIGFSYILILLCYSVGGWVSFDFVVYIFFGGVEGMFSLIIFYYVTGAYFLDFLLELLGGLYFPVLLWPFLYLQGQGSVLGWCFFLLLFLEGSGLWRFWDGFEELLRVF